MRSIWVCRSVGDFKDIGARALSFSHDGSLLAVAYKETITLWDSMTSTFQRSLTFTNCVKGNIKHLAFVPSSRYLISATDSQLFVWDLLRAAVIWSYSLAVKKIAVDASVNYKSNLVFPSPTSLVSAFLVTDGEHIFLFKPSSPKPLNVWKVEKRQVVSLAFASTSSLQPEGRIVYLNNKSELVYIEKKFDVKKRDQQDKEKLSLSMSKVSDVKKEKLSAFESAFGKLNIQDTKAVKEEQPVRAEDVGIPVPREDTGTLFNPTAPKLSHLFNGPSHLLPSPVKIYSSFMDGLLKKAHTHVATDSATSSSGQQNNIAAADNESAMQVDENRSAAVMPQMDIEDSTSKNQQKRLNKATEKTFYDSMFRFFSSHTARDEEKEMPASLLNELTAPVKTSRSKPQPNSKKTAKESRKEQDKQEEQAAKTTTTTKQTKVQEQNNSESTPKKARGGRKKNKEAESTAMDTEADGGSATEPQELTVTTPQSNGSAADAKKSRRRRKSGNKKLAVAENGTTHSA